MKYLWMIGLFAMSGYGFSQGASGALKGTVHNVSGAPASFAYVTLKSGGSEMKMVADIDGHFSFSPLNPGTYRLFLMSGEDTTKFQIEIDPDETTIMNDLVLESSLLDEFYVYEPMIDPEETTKITLDWKEIENSPNLRDPKALLATMDSGIKLLDDEIYFRGSRSDAMIQFIDGIKVGNTVTGLPGRAIGKVSVYSGGIPAKYGDTTGGVIVMETKSYFQLFNAANANF